MNDVLLTLMIGLTWLVMGFISGSFNHLVWKPNYTSRTPAFVVTTTFWPIMIPFNILVIIFRFVTRGMSLTDWMDFLDDVPNRLEQRKVQKRLRKQKDIMA